MRWSQRRKIKKCKKVGKVVDSDSEAKKSLKQEREDKVEKTLKILKTKHSTFMQYRIWSEMVANGMHTDLDNPPVSSMFKSH